MCIRDSSKLIAKAEGAAGGDNGVVHLNTAEGHFCIHHTISSFSSTGPSLQIRLLPYFVLQEQPMQAPKPQPIRSSKLNWPEVLQALYTACLLSTSAKALLVHHDGISG